MATFLHLLEIRHKDRKANRPETKTEIESVKSFFEKMKTNTACFYADSYWTSEEVNAVLHYLFQIIKMEGLQLILGDHHYLNFKPRYGKERALYNNITDEYRCRSSHTKI